MTILEAWSNRGLLVPETKPVYRVTFGLNRYDKNTVEIEAATMQTAKQELQEKWEAYANANGIPVNSVLDLHCVNNHS